MDKVNLPSEVDVKNVKFSVGANKSTNKMQAKIINVAYDTGDSRYNKKFLIQTPAMITPFGADCYEAKVAAAAGASGSSGVQSLSAPVGKMTMSLSFDPSSAFYAKMQELDEYIIDAAFEKKAFHGDSKNFQSRDFAVAVYNPIVKHAKNANYPPTIKLNLPTGDNNEYKFPTFTMVKNKPVKINLAEVNTVGAEVVAIIQCSMVYVQGSVTYGTSWKMVQLLVQPRAPTPEYAFVGEIAYNPEVEEKNLSEDDDDEEEEEEKKKKSTTKKASNKGGVINSSTLAKEDSREWVSGGDDEEEEEEEEEVEEEEEEEEEGVDGEEEVEEETAALSSAPVPAPVAAADVAATPRGKTLRGKK
jgi:hypothetical protein